MIITWLKDNIYAYYRFNITIKQPIFYVIYFCDTHFLSISLSNSNMEFWSYQKNKNIIKKKTKNKRFY